MGNVILSKRHELFVAAMTGVLEQYPSLRRYSEPNAHVEDYRNHRSRQALIAANAAKGLGFGFGGETK